MRMSIIYIFSFSCELSNLQKSNMSFRNILIAIDGTTESQHALNYYAHFFYKPQDDITIIGIFSSSANSNVDTFCN